MMARLLRTIGVWYLYYPHRALLRVLGTGPAIRLSRATAFIHWLFTFVGAESATRRSMRAASTSFSQRHSLSTILRRHLRIKHQHYVEWYTYASEAGRRYVRATYQQVEGREHLERALAMNRGVVVVMYHFGVGKMIFPALDMLGFETYHHVFRGATYEGKVFGSLAHKAMEAMAEAEKSSGLKVIFHRPGYTFPIMVRLLKKNAIVGMNADGMTGTEFVEVPFLGGTMDFPTGPVRLAAVGGSPIVPVFGYHDGAAAHRLVIHPPIEVGADTPEHVESATRMCSSLLGQHVRNAPWAWWTWRRLEVRRTEQGTLRYHARVLKQEGGAFHHEALKPTGHSTNRDPGSSGAANSGHKGRTKPTSPDICYASPD